MAGGFAHVTVSAAARERIDEAEGLTNDHRKAITGFQTANEVGAVGPDYPYLAKAAFELNEAPWADRMHYEFTGRMVTVGLRLVKETAPGATFDKRLAWLAGYAAHVATDLTIHPVVEARVGPYFGNEAAHRTCEMHQDAYIWPRHGLGELGLSEYFDTVIGPLTIGNGLDPAIREMWRAMLKEIYPTEFAAAPPDIDAWHRGFRRAVDVAEEGYRLFPFARHLLAGKGVAYPREDEIDRSFIEDLATPEGRMSYDQVFDRAVENVLKAWGLMGRALEASTPAAAETFTPFPDANLDDGKLLADRVTYALWRTA